MASPRLATVEEDTEKDLAPILPKHVSTQLLRIQYLKAWLGQRTVDRVEECRPSTLAYLERQSNINSDEYRVVVNFAYQQIRDLHQSIKIVANRPIENGGFQPTYNVIERVRVWQQKTVAALGNMKIDDWRWSLLQAADEIEWLRNFHAEVMNRMTLNKTDMRELDPLDEGHYGG